MQKRYQIAVNDGRIYALGGTPVTGGMHFSFVSKGTACAVILYRRGARLRFERVEFPADSRTGDVWSMTLLGDFTGLEYVYEEDGKETPDPYGRQFSGRERWGSLERLGKPVRTPVVAEGEAYDWEGDKLPGIPYEDCVMYHIHPRGFTRHASSGVNQKARGTFMGVVEKIPYLLDLGITTVEMMPPVEFEEIIIPESRDGSPFEPKEPDGKLNYWGYCRGYVFAPKYSYSSAQDSGPVKEFKDMVKALHRAGLELIVELYFDGQEALSYVLDAVRFWAGEYHVDGVRLVGYAPKRLLSQDPYLSSLKLLASDWEGAEPGTRKHLAEYNEGFMMDMRSLLKGDEGRLNHLLSHTRRNPELTGVVNFMADTNGFTMMDMVSYDVKHNEANGEDNRDGTDYNASWNCGVEGASRKKRIVRMRRKQIRNAMLMLFLAQGTPLLMMGDEFGRTKKGNNNSYCQDNDISWVNWGLLKANRGLFEFVKYLIHFRKIHGVFHMAKEPALMDYRSVGIPDMSCHGEKAWCPVFDPYCRQFGILYCGEYGKTPDGSVDDSIYVAYNMHWEPHEFALPNLPRDLSWHVAFNTDDDEAGGMYPPDCQPAVRTPKKIMVAARTIMVLVGMRDPESDMTGKKASAETSGKLKEQVL